MARMHRENEWIYKKKIIKMKDNNVKNVKRWETEQVAIQSVVEESNSANNSRTILFLLWCVTTAWHHLHKIRMYPKCC